MVADELLNLMIHNKKSDYVNLNTKSEYVTCCLYLKFKDLKRRLVCLLLNIQCLLFDKSSFYYRLRSCKYAKLRKICAYLWKVTFAGHRLSFVGHFLNLFLSLDVSLFLFTSLKLLSHFVAKLLGVSCQLGQQKKLHSTSIVNAKSKLSFIDSIQPAKHGLTIVCF